MDFFQIIQSIVAALFHNSLVTLKSLQDQIFGLVSLSLQLAQRVTQLRGNLIAVSYSSFTLVHQIDQFFLLARFRVFQALIVMLRGFVLDEQALVTDWRL